MHFQHSSARFGIVLMMLMVFFRLWNQLQFETANTVEVSELIETS